LGGRGLKWAVLPIFNGEKMLKMIDFKILMALFAGVLALSIVACASTQGRNRVEMEKLLMSAGFKKGVPDSPTALDQLKKLPQRQIVAREEGEKAVYIYADVENCQCAYAGNEEAYKKYQKLVSEKQLVERDRREEVRERQRRMDEDGGQFNRSW